MSSLINKNKSLLVIRKVSLPVYKKGHEGVYRRVTLPSVVKNKLRKEDKLYFEKGTVIYRTSKGTRRVLIKTVAICFPDYFGVTKKLAKASNWYYKTEDVFNCMPENITMYKWLSTKKDQEYTQHEILRLEKVQR